MGNRYRDLGASWEEVTGVLGVDWTPDTNTLVYDLVPLDLNNRALVGPADQGALSISCGPPAHDGTAWDYDAEYELGGDAVAALAPHDSKDA